MNKSALEIMSFTGNLKPAVIIEGKSKDTEANNNVSPPMLRTW